MKPEATGILSSFSQSGRGNKLRSGNWFIIALVLMLPAQLKAQETQWNGFMDINALYSDDTLSFNLGQLDLYVTSELTDHISFLAENTFTVLSDGNFSVAVERAIVKYEVDYYLNIQAGKHHTPVSYWNDTYHHGRVLQPSAGRPLVFARRIFPMHITGLMATGDYIGERNFSYRVMVANGRGSSPLKDNDKYKGFGFTAGISPVEDLKITGGSWFDRISAGVKNLQDTVLTESIRQMLFSVTATYLPTGKNVELLSEVFFINNAPRSGGSARTAAGYVHLGYTLGKVTPYYRFDYIEVDNNDRFFEVEDVTGHTAGVRYSFSYLANIKLEYQVSNYETARTDNTVALQIGVGF